MSKIIDFLALLLEKDSYDLQIVDILLKHGQGPNIDKIYEGAKKLTAEPEYLINYFKLLENNPQNANIFAKNILLLHRASFLNPGSSEEDLQKVSRLGIGDKATIFL